MSDDLEDMHAYIRRVTRELIAWNVGTQVAFTLYALLLAWFLR